jgi:hypothetical protein
MDLLPWPSYWLPHPWCENTVSHHGVNVAASFLLFVSCQRLKRWIKWTVWIKGIAALQFVWFCNSFGIACDMDPMQLIKMNLVKLFWWV